MRAIHPGLDVISMKLYLSDQTRSQSCGLNLTKFQLKKTHIYQSTRVRKLDLSMIYDPLSKQFAD
jgi:hypothetical protein